ncbi:MAG: ABC transporter permease [Chloroflexota bacterium]
MATTTAQQSPDVEFMRPQRSLWRDAWQRLIGGSTGRIGLTIALSLALIAVFVPVVMPYDPLRDRDLRVRLLEPSWLLSADDREQRELGLMSHPFGTDDLGRDVFVRVLHGSRVSLTAGLFAVSMAVVFGSLLGLIAGYVGGWVDTIAVWIMDIMLAFPSILLAIAIVSVRGPGLFNTLLAVGIVEIPIFGRIARATVLSIREQEYITAAKATGVSAPRALFLHVLPNSLAPMMVQATLSIATAIISIAALGFLGLGAERPTPEWGTMLSDARDYIGQGKWWYATFPGLAIMMTVLGFNLLGDGLRDALDPRLRR